MMLAGYEKGNFHQKVMAQLVFPRWRCLGDVEKNFCTLTTGWNYYRGGGFFFHNYCLYFTISRHFIPALLEGIRQVQIYALRLRTG